MRLPNESYRSKRKKPPAQTLKKYAVHSNHSSERNANNYCGLN